jgi:hypothetical protein
MPRTKSIAASEAFQMCTYTQDVPPCSYSPWKTCYAAVSHSISRLPNPLPLLDARTPPLHPTTSSTHPLPPAAASTLISTSNTSSNSRAQPPRVCPRPLRPTRAAPRGTSCPLPCHSRACSWPARTQRRCWQKCHPSLHRRFCTARRFSRQHPAWPTRRMRRRRCPDRGARRRGTRAGHRGGFGLVGG